MNPNIQRARQNEDQALQAIGLVGWLTTAQVAAWVWPTLSPHSARNRAAEVLTRLTDRRYLMRRQALSGTWTYLLTNPGAARATAAGDLVHRHGYDLSQLDVYRQALIVTHLLDKDSGRKLGPAGVRAAVRSELLEEGSALCKADALTWDAYRGQWEAAIVVRSLHPDLLAKARRLRAVASELQLLGHAIVVRQFGAAI
jgi:hypothetical protein